MNWGSCLADRDGHTIRAPLPRKTKTKEGRSHIILRQSRQQEPETSLSTIHGRAWVPGSQSLPRLAFEEVPGSLKNMAATVTLASRLEQIG